MLCPPLVPSPPAGHSCTCCSFLDIALELQLGHCDHFSAAQCPKHSLWRSLRNRPKLWEAAPAAGTVPAGPSQAPGSALVRRLWGSVSVAVRDLVVGKQTMSALRGPLPPWPSGAPRRPRPRPRPGRREASNAGPRFLRCSLPTFVDVDTGQPLSGFQRKAAVSVGRRCL